MKNLIQVNKREIGFSLLNGFLGGAGTAAGFVFSLLGALTALLGLSGPLLIGVSIGALILFSALALLVGAYFFRKSLNAGKNLNKKLINEDEMLKDRLIEHVILAPQKKLHHEELPLENTSLKLAYLSLAQKIKEKLHEKGWNESEVIQDTNLIKYRDSIKSSWNADQDLQDQNLQTLYLNYQRELLSPSSSTSSSLADSPTSSAFINSLIDCGCSLGPSLGLIGILSGLGVLGGLAALAPPVLLSLLITVTLVTLIGAYGVYYCESRNMRRNHLIMAMEEQIKGFTDPQKNIKLVRENPALTPMNNQEIYSSPLNTQEAETELLIFPPVSKYSKKFSINNQKSD